MSPVLGRSKIIHTGTSGANDRPTLTGHMGISQRIRTSTSGGPRPTLSGVSGLSQRIRAPGAGVWVYVGGECYGPTFEGEALPDFGGDYDAGWLTAFASDGEPTWSRIMPFTWSQTVRLAADSTGVYVYGEGGIWPDPPVGEITGYVTKYTRAGDIDWGPLAIDPQTWDLNMADGVLIAAHAPDFRPSWESISPRVFEPATGDVDWGINTSGQHLWGAAKGPGDVLYAFGPKTYPGVGGRGNAFWVYRIGPAGVLETVSAVVDDVITHPDRTKFYTWQFTSSSFALKRWAGDPLAVEATVLALAERVQMVTVDDSTGHIFLHGIGVYPAAGATLGEVRGYDEAGTLLWTTTTVVRNDYTQLVAKSGRVYVAGWVNHPELDAGLLPGLIVLDATTGDIIVALREWGEDCTNSADTYGLAVG